MRYEWDANKQVINLANHKVNFALAEHFDWTTARIEPDMRKNYGEPRFIAYGLIETRLYYLVFTPRNNGIRIISLRKANPREVIRYVSEN